MLKALRLSEVANALGARVVGADVAFAAVSTDSRKIESGPESIAKSPLGPSDFRLPVSENHYRNFLDCVKSRKDPMEPVETGHRTASLCHLGNIAMQLHRKIKWDPKKEQAVGDAEAAKMVSRPKRAPYNFEYPLKA